MTVKRQITTWCQEEGILDEVIEGGEVDFHLKVRAPVPGADPSDGTVLDVTRPEAHADRIQVFGVMRFDEVFWDTMRELDLDEFADRIGPVLDALPVSCFLDYRDGTIRSVTVVDEIFLDGLTKDRLIRSLRDVHRSSSGALLALRPLVDCLLAPQENPGSEGSGAAATDLSVCPSCGQSGAPGRAYCSRCGARLAAGESTGGGRA